MSSESISSALETLANYRAHNTRASQEVIEKGSLILKSSKNIGNNLGDDAWAFLEQLALAAIDVGKYDVADECLHRLSIKFPSSPRVDVLRGIRIEATSPPAVALQYYDELLNSQENESNAAIWKRRISLLVHSNIDKDKTKAVEELVEYLDTFYTDVEAWVTLAEVYCSCNQYAPALSSLSHALLLSPTNPFYALQFAEVAYTKGDVPLALKMFLAAVEVAEGSNGPGAEGVEAEVPSGISVRAWYGVKLCCRTLLSSSSSPTDSSYSVPPPTLKHLNLLDELATERVLTAYSGSSSGAKGVTGRELVLSWMGPPGSKTKGAGEVHYVR